MSRLAKYRLYFPTSHTGPAAPLPPTLSALGVEQAALTFSASGADSLQLTAGVPLAEVGFPFSPLARHTLYDADNNVRFTGWLAAPGRAANASAQTQVFTFEGPNYLLRAVPYKEPWQFATNPASALSPIAPQPVSRMILFRDAEGNRRTLRDQVKEVLDYAINAGAAMAYGPLTDLPNLMPLEDEQQDQSCLAVLERILRYAPGVTRRWDYSGAAPRLMFIGASASTLTVISNDGTVENLQVTPRYDLLVRKITVHAMSSQEATDDPAVRWATLTTDESVADNGSIIEQVFTYTLRGESNRKDANGNPVIEQEALPAGIAEALHQPFKTLYESLQWAKSEADVDWAPTLGMLVSVHRVAGAGAAAESTLGLISNRVTTRSAIQQIMRKLETGTTSFQAGPPTALGLSDLLNARQAASSARNAANAGATHSGFKPGAKGPETQKTARCCEDGPDTAAATTAAARLDFALSDAGGGMLGITNGTVDGILPVGMTAGGEPPFKIAVTENDRYAFLRLGFSTQGTTPFYVIASVSIIVSPSFQPGSEAGGVGYFGLGDFVLDRATGKISIGSGKGGSGSKIAQYCGGRVLLGAI